jgi:hypothetical protein
LTICRSTDGAIVVGAVVWFAVAMLVMATRVSSDTSVPMLGSAICTSAEVWPAAIVMVPDGRFPPKEAVVRKPASDGSTTA